MPLVVARRRYIGGGWGCMDVEGARSASEDGQQGFQGRGSQEPRPGSGASAAQQALSGTACRSKCTAVAAAPQAAVRAPGSASTDQIERHALYTISFQ